MNIQAIDLNLLLVFEALMDERNVTRAAARVGLSQPAMSNALARLRRTLDDALLVRTPDGMAPTPRAQALVGPVRAALEQLRTALENRPTFDPAESKRTFHVLANDYVELLLLAPMLDDLQARAGEISLRLYRPRSLFQPPEPTLFADSFDLAIGFYPDALGLDASIRSEVIWTDNNVCIARRGHPEIRGRLSLEQYAAARHVAVFYKSHGPGLIDSLLEQHGLSRRPSIFVPHFSIVPEMVAASDFIATIPEKLARHFGHLNLQILPMPLDLPSFRLTILWHERSEHDPAHAWLREMFLSRARPA